MDRDLLVARYVLRDLDSYDLIPAALALLAQGESSTSLAALAGATRDEHPADLRRLFERAIDEMLVVVPDELEAARIFARHLAREACAGRIDALAAARRIVELQRDLPNGADLGARDVQRLYWELDECIDRDLVEHKNALASRLAAALAAFARG